jgi:hypothetical protein
MRTRWLVRMILVGAIGWNLPAASSAQESPPIPSPPPILNAPPAPTPVASETIPPTEELSPAPQESSGRFHILPQRFRDRVLRLFGRGPSQQTETIVPPPPQVVNPPEGASSSVIQTGTAAPQPQPVPLPPPEVVNPPMGAPPLFVPHGETWASPPEPPITTVAPLPLRDPSMAWYPQPLSAPTNLSPNAPPSPARFHILPKGLRDTWLKCINGCGMGCYADRDTLGCGSCRQEFLFVFGSCRYFFGEGCVPDY